MPRFLSLTRLPAVGLACLAATIAARAQSNYATPYAFTTLAGTSSIGSADGKGSAARFFAPAGVAVDAAGTIFVADTLNHTIRRIATDGIVSTLAGKPGWPGAVDGAGPTARFNAPEAIAVDANGHLYVADTGNRTIRRISPAGIVVTIAGVAGQTGSSDGAGSSALFDTPRSVAMDPAGNLVVADTGNHSIRKVSSQGFVQTLAGLLAQPGHTDGSIFEARFRHPTAITVDALGNIYIADAGNRAIRKITTAGKVDTLANGIRSQGITVTAEGTLYFADDRYRLLRLTASGSLTVFAGKALEYGGVDGPGGEARFGYFDVYEYEYPNQGQLKIDGPRNLAMDAAGNLLVADTQNNTIRRVTSTGIVSTFAGLGVNASQGSTDAAGSAARFGWRSAIAAGSSGELYVADSTNHVIRKISPGGTVTTFAGDVGNTGSADGIGTLARFSEPRGIAVDRDGIVYVADTGNRTIRRINTAGQVTTWVGTAGQGGIKDGPGADARFVAPTSLAVDGGGTVYVADYDVIRKITPQGLVSTFAGSEGYYYRPEEPFASTWYETVESVAVNPTGQLYGSYQMHMSTSHAVDFFSSSSIRQFNPDGTYLIRAGSATMIGSRDGPENQATFDRLRGLTVDQANNIYVADYLNQVIRRINPDGEVTTIAGLVDARGSADGAGSDVRFTMPTGLAMDSDGTLYVTTNASIRRGRLASAPVITTQPQSQTVTTGGSVTFSIAASGAPDPTYQWYFNGTPFSGATDNTLSFSNARSTDAGEYTVVVTNSLGSATSAKATLTVSASSSPGGGGSSGGGGGSPSLLFFATLLVLAALRRPHAI